MATRKNEAMGLAELKVRAVNRTNKALFAYRGAGKIYDALEDLMSIETMFSGDVESSEVVGMLRTMNEKVESAVKIILAEDEDRVVELLDNDLMAIVTFLAEALGASQAKK